jgi:integrase
VSYRKARPAAVSWAVTVSIIALIDSVGLDLPTGEQARMDGEALEPGFAEIDPADYVREQLPLSPEMESAMATARELAAASRSDNTRANYRSGWNQFLRFAREHHPASSPLPANPALVALYLGWLRDLGRTSQTLRARAASISFHHRQAELPSPCDHKYVKDVLEGASRKDAGREHGRATVTLEDLHALLARLPDPEKLIEVRDRAVALLTFATSRRRSEIAALDLKELDFSRRDFLLVRIARSKTDQHGVGTTVAVPRLPAALARVCAVRAVERWITLSTAELPKATDPAIPLFRAFSIGGELSGHRIEPRAVAAILKRLYAHAGFSETHIKSIGAHSLRRGFVTSADAAGSTAAEIMAVTGHRDRRMLDRYTNHEKTKNPPLLRMFSAVPDD